MRSRDAPVLWSRAVGGPVPRRAVKRSRPAGSVDEQEVHMSKTRTMQADADPAVLAARIARQHVADALDVLNALPRDAAAGILAYLPHEQVVGVFDKPQLDAAAALLQRLPTPQASAVPGGLSAASPAALLRTPDGPAR